MASYAEQLQTAKAAHYAVEALDDQARNLIAQAFTDWDNGLYDAQTIRHRIEAVVRAAYRQAASLGPGVAARASDIPDWTPAVPFNNEYLQSLLKDVRRNLREFKAAKGEDADKIKRKAILNVQHSAGVGAERGYTDAVLSAYQELADFGYIVEKYWLNNFDNGNVPCPFCRALHGKKAKLGEAFKTPQKVYLNLQGPPLHPRCHCYLAVIVRSLENALEQVDIEEPTLAPDTMTTAQIKKIPLAIFKAVVAALGSIRKKFGKKMNYEP